MVRHVDERTKKGLHLIQAALRLTSSDVPVPEDIVLVAIDFENSSAIRRNGEIVDAGIEIGLALLDTRDLEPLSDNKDNIISTYNFAAGSAKFGAAASNRFLFGASSTITVAEILQSIESIIPRSRNLILAGFGSSYDLIALRRLKVDLKTSICGIIDTEWIAKEVFSSFTGSFEDLLCLLKCPYGRLHCAGNDAHFVLRALLLLAARDNSRGVLIDDRADLLKRIAYDPIQSPDVKEPRLQVTPMTKRERQKVAYEARRQALTSEERARSKAVFEEDKARAAADKARRIRKIQQKREAKLNAKERFKAERAQKRESHQEIDLDGLESLF